jgi:MoaA/NifB/PqqE/SkfB family radical SAM enzyme
MNRKLSILGYDLYSRFIRTMSINGFAFLPPLIIFEPTFKCNLRCTMCTLYGMGAETPVLKEEMTLEEVKKIFTNIKNSYYFFLPRIHLTGGEPLFHKYFCEIIEYITNLGFTYSVTSNFAFLNDDILHSLIKYPPQDLRISIDGPAEIHDSIRGVKGTFNKVMNNIEIIRKAGLNVPVRFNCTISRYNIDYLEQLIDISQKANAQLNYQHLIFLDEKHIKLHYKYFDEVFKCKASPMGHEEKISVSDTNGIIEKIKKIKIINNKITFLPDLKLSQIKPYYLDLDNYTHSTYCHSVWTVARIDSSGNVYPCYEYFFGNLKRGSFSKLWNNTEAIKFRKTLKKVKLFPGCIRCCKI